MAPRRPFHPRGRGRVPSCARPTAIVAVVAATVGAGPARAQDPVPSSLPRVVVSTPALPQAEVAGFEPQPLARLPLQASVIDEEQWRSRGGARLADLVRLDASVGDAYNAPGYWDFLAVRGFALDNRFNFRRDGLPINAETSIPLDNKERLELLKGTSGLQAGVSAPGGLVNLVVKRPGDVPIRRAILQVEQRGSVLGSVDLAGRVGPDEAVGLRLNAATERLDPRQNDIDGRRHLLALAADWKGPGGLRVEVEGETSRRRQPSAPGFSLLGDALPAPADPRLNLNNQPWSTPNTFDAATGSLRISAPLVAGWRWKLHAARQQLRTDDRLAFPFGCSAEGRFDRFCSDGTFDLYDFRSDGERRRSDALEASLRTAFETGALRHDLSIGWLASRTQLRFAQQAFNFVGIGTVDGRTVVPADPTLTTENTNRDEAGDELFARHGVSFGETGRLWTGLRLTRLERRSVRTDGTEPAQSTQRFAVPFVALSASVAPGVLGYASFGQGIESEIAPNRPAYTNAGRALPALRSRQWELGLKGLHEGADPGAAATPAAADPSTAPALTWGAALFDIVRPAFADLGACDGTAGSCTRQRDGAVRHLGLELQGEWRDGPWTLGGSAMVLRARRQGSVLPVNGLKPTNVPPWTLRGFAQAAPASWAGVAAFVALSAGGARAVLPDNSASIPATHQWDIGLQQTLRDGAQAWTWRLGIDNLLDRRAWREAPFQFGHVYLYPQPARTVRASLQIDL